MLNNNPKPRDYYPPTPAVANSLFPFSRLSSCSQAAHQHPCWQVNIHEVRQSERPFPVRTSQMYKIRTIKARRILLHYHFLPPFLLLLTELEGRTMALYPSVVLAGGQNLGHWLDNQCNDTTTIRHQSGTRSPGSTTFLGHPGDMASQSRQRPCGQRRHQVCLLLPPGGGAGAQTGYFLLTFRANLLTLDPAGRRWPCHARSPPWRSISQSSAVGGNRMAPQKAQSPGLATQSWGPLP